MAPSNILTTWGNEKTMNMNLLILTNIQSSPYFKVNLYELKTYHEVIDEIYYKVNHLEPWEKGSRKTAGQTGMCGGVRGVGAGGIVSSAYCLLYKLFTLKLTRKQVVGLTTHKDSPYIRGLGFMYIRYTQAPAELWEWYEPFLDDEEEIDVRAGGGGTILIGEMVRLMLAKLDWYSTLFPRIPVPIQKDLQAKLKAHPPVHAVVEVQQPEPEHIPDDALSFGEAERHSYNNMSRSASPSMKGSRDRSYRPPAHRGDRSPKRSPRRSPHRRSSPRRSPHRRVSPQRSSPRRSPPRRHKSPSRRKPEDRYSPSMQGSDGFAEALLREKERQKREHGSRERRSRSRDRPHRSNRDRPQSRRSRSSDRHHSSKYDKGQSHSRSYDKYSRHDDRDHQRSRHQEENGDQYR